MKRDSKLHKCKLILVYQAICAPPYNNLLVNTKECHKYLTFVYTVSFSEAKTIVSVEMCAFVKLFYVFKLLSIACGLEHAFVSIQNDVVHICKSYFSFVDYVIHILDNVYVSRTKYYAKTHRLISLFHFLPFIFTDFRKWLDLFIHYKMTYTLHPKY